MTISPKTPPLQKSACRRFLAVVFLCAFSSVTAHAVEKTENPILQKDLTLLADPDLSSPRATLKSLQQSVQRAYDVLAKAYEEHRNDSGFGVSEAVERDVTTGRLLLRQAVSTLDLSQVPLINREKIGIETVFLLKEIFDRLPTIQYDDIPGATDVAKAQSKSPILNWSLPYSDIHIVRVKEGRDTGDYLFSTSTVARAPEFYSLIKEFSERTDAKQDLFEFYSKIPGNLLPSKWHQWIEASPEWTRISVSGLAVWQWIGFAFVLVALFGAYWAVWHIRRRTAVFRSEFHSAASRLVMTILLVLVAVLAQWIMVEELNISGWVFSIANKTLYAIAYGAAAWTLYFMLVTIAEYIISSPRIDPASIDASLLRIAARIAGISAGIGLIFYGAMQIGISLYGVIAGLGVGGLALGLAARPTLENLIGGLILYADRPVRVGDFCGFNDTMGTVEEIGLRSTRIRARDRTLITIPNAEFSNMQLVNWSRRDQSMMKIKISLRYETTAKQMREVIERITERLLEHPEVDHDKVRVRFRELGEYALRIEVRAYLKTTSNSYFLEIQQELYLDFMKIIEDCGTAMALPSNTTYHVMHGGNVPEMPDALAPGR